METELENLVKELCSSVQDAQYVLETFNVERYFQSFSETNLKGKLKPLAINAVRIDGYTVSAPIAALIPQGSLNFNDINIQMTAFFRSVDGGLLVNAVNGNSIRSKIGMEFVFKRNEATSGTSRLLQQASSYHLQTLKP